MMQLKQFCVLFVVFIALAVGCSAVTDAISEEAPGDLADGASEVADRAGEARENDDDGSTGDEDDSSRSVTERASDSVTERTSESYSEEAQRKLQSCQSAGRSALSHAEDIANRDENHLHDHDIAHKIGRVDKFEADCITGDDLTEIKTMPGYAEVEKNHRKATGLVAEYHREEEEEFETAMAEGLGAEKGINEGFQQQRVRWRNRPPRCWEAEDWNEAVGIEKEEDTSTAAISGSELIEDEPQVTGVPEDIFGSSIGRHFGPDEFVARYACGRDIEGIDSFFSDNRGYFGGRIGDNDPRSVLGDALQDEDVDGDRRTIYAALAGHLCWYATNWDLQTGYGAYLYCRDVADDLPTLDEVDAAMSREFPDFEFGHRNMRFMYERALQAKEEVDAAFTQLEEKYPKQKEVYYESGKRAEETYAQRRQDYAHIFEDIDPITERLLIDASARPPENCRSTVEAARQTLADEIGVSSEEDLRTLRSDHPVGYQITEALTYCYIGEGRLARAYLEAQALEVGTRRVTLGEEISVARNQALHEVVEEYRDSTTDITEVIPFYERRHSYPIPLPTSTHDTPNFFPRAGGPPFRAQLVGGPDPDAADDDDDDNGKQEIRAYQRNVRAAPIIETKRDVADGTKIVFVTDIQTVTRQNRECESTGEIQAWVQRGNRLEAEYKQRCWPVGEPWTEEIEHQHDSVVLPAEQAALLEPGMRVELLNNRHSNAVGDDAVIRHAWAPGAESGDPVVIDGIDMR